MNRRFAPIVAIPAVLLLLGLGCGSSDASGNAVGGAGDSHAAASNEGPTASLISPDKITFDWDGGAVLDPGEVVTVSLAASPPGRYELRLSLLDGVEDASLDKGRVTTDEGGRASVELTAPTRNTEFTLRVSSGEASAQSDVRVLVSPTASLTVVPVYDGERDTPTWTAEVHAGQTCRELATAEKPPTATMSVTAEHGSDLLLDGLRAGEPLAISVGYERAVSGCTEVSGLEADQNTPIEVGVYDLPAQVDNSDLEVHFDADVTFNAWWDGLTLSIQPAVDSVFGMPADDVPFLLNTMAETLDADSAQAYAEAREQHGWDGVLRETWGNESPTRVSGTLTSWLASGVETASAADVFLGTLDTTTTPETPRMPLTSLAGIDATQAALATPVDVELELESSDSLSLAGRFYWQPSRLLTALAWETVSNGATESGTAPEALAGQIDCAGVARNLVSATGNTTAFNDCDEDCLIAACVDACDLIWIALRGASAQRSSEATLEWAATTDAVVDADSQLVSFEGDWVGTMASEGTTLSLRGTVRAVSPSGG